MIEQLRAYIATQAPGNWAYFKQEAVTGLLSWIPALPGIAARGIGYRLILSAQGLPAIERSVRIAYAGNIRLGRNVYIDHGVYLHACPHGIDIGDDSFVMHESILHVFNFRSLPAAGITIVKRCFIGERSIIRGQGGVTIEDDVLLAPGVQILAVNHIYASTRVPVMEQGIDARGIVIERGAWIGAGAIVTDGVRVGRNAVVGAGAVVTRDVPAGTVVVGVPARPVKTIADIEPPQDIHPAAVGMARANGRVASG